MKIKIDWKALGKALWGRRLSKIAVPAVAI